MLRWYHHIVALKAFSKGSIFVQEHLQPFSNCLERQLNCMACVLTEKPLVIEEFGKTVNASVPDRNEFQRYQFYKLVYSQVEDSIEDGDVLKGIMFWRFAGTR